ncbi:hypothetical protein [Burkholderia sp. LAS2]|uniref:TubC N-terminal docking domain-related protein n=1 Tax=Burkholderia sp. LAS2 TaxID=2813843 RepID=UPI001BD133EE|nr:hypothetical protein [Burkholderia sp. LAS2]QVN10285.1 hypothetical protein JYG37_13155 [Burkholderia sp. LAS2]
MSSVAQILGKAESLGVRLRLDGEIVRMNGPKDARDAIRADVIAHKPEIVAHLRAAADDAEPIPADCVGALHDPDGGLYLPWGPRLSAQDVDQLRAEVINLIEQLAHVEGWASARRDDVLTRAIRGPLADLLPNLAYFRERLDAAYAEAAACAVLDRRT